MAEKGKDVALVLSSGGPRGFTYLGAIDQLEKRGYRITSVAGCSIGSLVGGIYAAGGMKDFKKWLYKLDNYKLMQLMDVSISSSYLIKGTKVIDAIKEVVPDKRIEDLPIPFAAVATDLLSGEKVVFRSGDLFEAIRASISIPSMFMPVKVDGRILVDGGVVDTIPYDIVERKKGDILVGFDVNDIPGEPGKFPGMHEVTGNDVGNYFSILSRTFSLMNYAIAREQNERYRPDILVKLPFDTYTSIEDYGKVGELASLGRKLMNKALDEYEASQSEKHRVRIPKMPKIPGIPDILSGGKGGKDSKTGKGR